MIKIGDVEMPREEFNRALQAIDVKKRKTQLEASHAASLAIINDELASLFPNPQRLEEIEPLIRDLLGL